MVIITRYLHGGVSPYPDNVYLCYFQACKVSCLVSAMNSSCGCVIFELKYSDMPTCKIENADAGRAWCLVELIAIWERVWSSVVAIMEPNHAD